MHSRAGQAAFEYLVTYGWAILAAIMAIGALSYFGFVSPSNLLSNRCNFGKQMECTDYQILDDGTVKLTLRNNFGKPIAILDVNMAEDAAGVTGVHPFNVPVTISSGFTNETIFNLDAKYAKPEGQKQSLNLIINFTRTDIANAPSHIVVGYVFTGVAHI
jgi:hypothetical protein